MSCINDLILEATVDLSHLNNYKSLNKKIRLMHNTYKKAIQCHNSGDSMGFLQNTHLHRQLEHSIHSDLASPTFIQGSSKVQARRIASGQYLHDLQTRTSGW